MGRLRRRGDIIRNKMDCGKRERAGIKNFVVGEGVKRDFGVGLCID